jgi:alpha-tubulin suppressor-like RCC1 family protein
LWAWGNNNNGNLGTSDTTNRSSPVQIGSLSNWTQIYTGPMAYHNFALQSNGILWGWGKGASGQLGNSTTTTNIYIPTLIPFSNIKKIGIGGNHSLFVIDRYF